MWIQLLSKIKRALRILQVRCFIYGLISLCSCWCVRACVCVFSHILCFQFYILWYICFWLYCLSVSKCVSFLFLVVMIFDLQCIYTVITVCGQLQQGFYMYFTSMQSYMYPSTLAYRKHYIMYYYFMWKYRVSLFYISVVVG